MSTGLKANLDGSAAIQVGGSDAIQLTTGLAATFVNNVSVAGTASVTGNLSFNSGYGSAAVAYGCRAWVFFNGTGTVAINANGNVSSITDNGTGDYTINFTNAMPDANYAMNGNSVSGGTSIAIVGLAINTNYSGTPLLLSTTQCRIQTRNDVGSLQDMSQIYCKFTR